MRSSLYRGLACSLLLVGCPGASSNMSVDEVQQALEESALSSQAETLLADGVEISTNFTIGDALEKAAQELQDFVGSQLPCANITREAAKLSVIYGAKAGNCSFHGHTIAGEHTVTVMRNAANEVAVHHEWSDFNDGHVSISGSADVNWSRTAMSRHVQHEITWTILSGRYKGQTGTGRGDRTQMALDAGLATGMQVNGTRSWDGKHGHFDLDVDGVEIRWTDPVPQAGSYVLTTSKGNVLSLSFHRIDADSIQVSAKSGAREFAFEVMADGRVER
jgi:hypothetical protein